jgi:hypothetical protein
MTGRSLADWTEGRKKIKSRIFSHDTVETASHTVALMGWRADRRVILCQRAGARA